MSDDEFAVVEMIRARLDRAKLMGDFEVPAFLYRGDIVFLLDRCDRLIDEVERLTKLLEAL